MAIFLPIVPNWRNGVRDVYEFKTDIFTSRNGTEQRRSQRIQPRRSITAAILLDGERLRNFADALNKARDGKVEISDFSGDPAYSTETMLEGDVLLKLSTIPPWLVSGAYLSIVTGRTAVKARVDFVSDLTVALSAPVRASIGMGAKILPLVPASLEESTTLSIYTNLMATTSIKFNIEPGTVVRTPDPLPDENTPTPTQSAFNPAAIFQGRYVLLRKPNYVAQPQVAFNLGFETVDYGRGVTKTFTPLSTISRTLTATYSGMSREGVLSLLDIFLRCRGQSGEIFVPTWGSDLPEILLVSVDTIRVKGTDFYDTYFQDPAHAAILLRGHDGTLTPCSIQHMYLSDGDTWIVCEKEINKTAAQISHASWLFVARFAQDAITVDWKTDGVASVVLSFVTLANLAAEDSFGGNWILATGYWRDRGVWEDTNVWND